MNSSYLKTTLNGTCSDTLLNGCLGECPLNWSNYSKDKNKRSFEKDLWKRQSKIPCVRCLAVQRKTLLILTENLQILKKEIFQVSENESLQTVNMFALEDEQQDVLRCYRTSKHL